MFPEYHFQQFTIYTDPEKTNVKTVHKYLSEESYWAQNIPLQTVAKALKNSLCFSVYKRNDQVGFARLVTDKATFAYLCDVYILPEFRGLGLAKWLMQCIKAHPDLQQIRRFMLATKDAHTLYEKSGFKPIADASRLMEILNRDIYKTN